MRRASTSLEIRAASAGLLALCLCVSATGQVSTTTTPPNRNLTMPSQRAQAPSHPQKQFPGAKATALTPAPAAGTVQGFVYWNATAIAHKPAGNCNGLAITVSVGSSNGPFQAYKPLGTLSNNFKYVGQAKLFLAGGKINVYDVCSYGYNHVPVGPNLQVKLTITQPTAFTLFVTPQFSTLGPITIINAQCNMLPNIVNPNATDLMARWGSCQNMAYDVNFVLVHPLPTLHPVTQPTPGAGSGLLSGNSGSQQGMLSGAPKQGMLAAGAVPSVQQPVPAGMLSGGSQPSSAQGVARPNPGSKVQLNPQPLPPRQKLTNLDVISMLRGGIPESTIIQSLGLATHSFDFSPSGCNALKRVHASRAILDAMGDGIVRPCFTGGVRTGAGS
jgi:hypothetical protein